MKNDIMKTAHYWYNFDRDIFYNRQARKAFSWEFVTVTPEEEILRHINESTDAAGWTFYFNSPPSEGVKRELERVLG